MKAFRRATGRVAVLDRSDVDTDQIIPKQFLKSIARTGFGEGLFFDWRLDEHGEPDRAGARRPVPELRGGEPGGDVVGVLPRGEGQSVLHEGDC